jgi:4'-phosphopantetheinyl transferase EntD
MNSSSSFLRQKKMYQLILNTKKQDYDWVLFHSNPIRTKKNTAIVACFCEFDSNVYHSHYYNEWNILFPESIQKAVIKRQAEFLVGRYAAHQAIFHLNSNFKTVLIPPIKIGKKRAPIWPKKITGSISHTHIHSFFQEEMTIQSEALSPKKNNSSQKKLLPKKSLAISLVTQSEKMFIGIDIEKIMSEQLANSIHTQIIQQNEHRLLINCSIAKKNSLSFSKGLSLIFSAKETLFKALYPHVNEYFFFHTAEVSNINFNSNHLQLKLKETFYQKHQLKTFYTIYFQWIDGGILTYLIDSI